MLFKNSKKGEIEVIKEIFIMIVVSVILISWILTLFLIKTYEIDERDINTELITKKLLSGNCFSDDYATFQESKMTSSVINECFKGLDERSLVRFQLGDDLWYVLERKEEFIQKANLCTNSGSLLCTQISYPVTYLDVKGVKSLKELKLQIITT